jgi:tetratricopeptide (TPR) repeat protein
VRRLTGDYLAAAQAQEEALGIYRDLADRLGETEVLDETGTLHQVRGEFTQAEKCHQRALDVARAISNSHFEASALAGLARCALATDDRVRAEVLLRQV